jgi:hypothetical protein
MTDKEKMVVKEILEPGMLRAFEPRYLEVEGLNRYQINGVISTLARAGIIERYDLKSWVLTANGVCLSRCITW